jgi:hypothetical protein
MGFLCCVLGGMAPAFSLEENWLSTDFAWGNLMEFDEGSRYLGAPGFNLKIYSFQDRKNMGFYFHSLWSFPAIAPGQHSDGGYDWMAELMLGPGFRYKLGEQLSLHGGLGIDWAYLFAQYTQEGQDYRKVLFTLGIAGDLGVKYDIRDFFYIQGGLMFSYMFANRTFSYTVERIDQDTVRQKQVLDDWVKGYALVGIKPYIGIGWSYYREKTLWGKPNP